MKRLLIGISAAASLFATSALAADLAAKAPVYTKAPVLEPVFNWTGFYIGGNLGYSWGNSDNTAVLSRFDTGAALLNGTVLSSNHVDGVIGGGQLGYNWQITNWLVGVEADIQGSGERGSSMLTCVNCANGNTSDIVTNLNQKLDWFGTVRGRIGILATPSVLLYATGGLAYGEVNVGGSATGNTAQGVPATVALAGTSSVRAGWTVGAGVEGAIGGGWTAKLEYLYMDLGSVSGGPEELTGILVPPRTNAGLSYSSAFTDNILRVGVNYKFGGPVVARY